MKPKIHIIVGARPNFIKAHPVYHSLNQLNKFELKLVNTGQHYDQNMSGVFIKELGMNQPDIDLEVGSGLGGCCLIIAGERDAQSVHGIDVEPLVINRAKQLVLQAGLEDQISFQHVEPGPLPVSSNSFDVIFSKDAFCHIEKKLMLYSELFRVLRPGGSIAIGDWMVRDEQGHSTEMETFIESTGLSLFMDSLTGVKKNLESVGFDEVEVINRNAWFQNEARAEADRLEGELAAAVVDLRGQEATDSSNECQNMMIAVLDSGEFCPAHFFAKKPG